MVQKYLNRISGPLLDRIDILIVVVPVNYDKLSYGGKVEHSAEVRKGLHKTSFTFNRRPLKLVYCKHFDSPMKAIEFEKQLKGWTRAKKVSLISNDLDLLHELARCKNETSHKVHNESG